MEEPKSKFKIGDWVRYRSARRIGIVVRCRNWPNITLKDWDYGYEVTFGTARINVAESSLERVE